MYASYVRCRQAAAACAGTDPRLFTDPRPDTDDTDRAIATCRRWPVRQCCLTEALDHPPDSDVGIWGADGADLTPATQRAYLTGVPGGHCPVRAAGANGVTGVAGGVVDGHRDPRDGQ